MTLTNSESQWLARVMYTISDVTFINPCNALDRPVQNGAGGDVLLAAQNFIEVVQSGYGVKCAPDGEQIAGWH